MPPEDLDNYARMSRQLRSHEGLRLDAYLDSMGILTIGYGHNCVAKPVAQVKKVGDRIDKTYAYVLYDADLTAVISICKTVFKILKSPQKLNPPRKAVIFNMAFNMGVSRLKEFVKMWAAIEAEDFETAAKEMLNSRWALQVHGRADELAEQMRSGLWQGAALTNERS